MIQLVKHLCGIYTFSPHEVMFFIQYRFIKLINSDSKAIYNGNENSALPSQEQNVFENIILLLYLKNCYFK